MKVTRQLRLDAFTKKGLAPFSSPSAGTASARDVLEDFAGKDQLLEFAPLDHAWYARFREFFYQGEWGTLPTPSASTSATSSPS